MKTLRFCLTAVAAATMAASVQAADIQLYGLIDTSIAYVHSTPDVAGMKSTSRLSMENAREFGSRWGIRGTEDLGNGYKIGFTLESGFESDTGALDSKQSGRLFGREASINLSTPWGTFWAGNLPIFGSVLSANGLFRAIDPLFANYTEGFSSSFATASRWTRVDNALSYRTPTWAGLTGYAMYSLKMDSLSKTDEGDEGKAQSDRYGSLALRYQSGALEAILVADTTLYGSKRAAEHEDDGYTVTIGGNYAFANGFKIITFAQWFKDQELSFRKAGVASTGVNAFVGDYGFVDGWGASIGAHYRIGNGTLKAGFNYRDMDNQDDVDFTRWTVCAAYDYNLSKRTSVYAMTGFSKEKIEKKDGSQAKPHGYEVVVGLLHRF